MTIALAVLAGSVGALARFEVSVRVQRRTGGRRPWGTAVVNVSGAFLLGLVVAFLAAGEPPDWLAGLAIGFFGGYTTFSTWMAESLALMREGRRAAWWLTANLGGMLALGVAGLGLGLAIGGHW